MKLTKIMTSFLALLLFATTFNSYSMEQPHRGNNYLGWAAIIGGVLLGAVAIKMLWQSQPSEPFPFTDLPKEIQDQIILLLSLNTTTTSLKEAVDTINSLAKVNKELNKLINNSKFCLQIIKHLAIKFNYSDEQVAAELQTKESQQRLNLQHELKLLCINDGPNFQSLCDQGVDLNFTYNTRIPHFFITPLMIAKWSGILNNLCSMKNKGLDINQRNSKGETALMMALKESHVSSPFFTLLKEGADPEIADNNGLTPLQFLQAKDPNQFYVKDAIKKIQDAIEKKHEKK